MKRLIAIGLVLLLTSGCSSFFCKGGFKKGDTIDRWPIAIYTPEGIGIVKGSRIDADEACALKAVQQAIINIKATNPKWAFIDPVERLGIFIVRNNTDQLPKLCDKCLFGAYKSNCADTWAEYPKVIGIDPTTPGWGYGGLTKGHMFLSYRGTTKKGADWLIGLVAHEWGCHEAADIWTHNDDCNEITRLVQSEARRIMADDPQCSQFSGE